MICCQDIVKDGCEKGQIKMGYVVNGGFYHNYASLSHIGEKQYLVTF